MNVQTITNKLNTTIQSGKINLPDFCGLDFCDEILTADNSFQDQYEIFLAMLLEINRIALINENYELMETIKQAYIVQQIEYNAAIMKEMDIELMEWFNVCNEYYQITLNEIIEK